MAFRTLSLCSGVAGLELGIRLAEPRARTVCYVEREAYAASILVARMEDKTLGEAPVWDDLFTFDGKPWRGIVDCITGGFPCTPHSVAGKQQGRSDERNLWPEFARIVREVSPTICFFENVPNLLNTMFSDVCEDLWGMGYRIEAGIFSAAEIGAPHLRKRLFIMAHGDSAGLSVERGSQISDKDPACRDHADRHGSKTVADGEGNGWDERRSESAWLEGRPDASISCGSMADSSQPGPQRWSRLEQTDEEREAQIGVDQDASGCGRVLANTVSEHLRIQSGWFRGKVWPDSPFPPEPGDAAGWAKMPDDAQPAIRRNANGPSARVDQLRCLGNAVVSQVAALAWRMLMMRFQGK